MQNTTSHKPAIQPDHGIADLIQKRWSPRAFADKPIAPDVLKQVFEGARWAPSAFNAQPWTFVYAHHGTPEFDKVVSFLMEGNRSWAKNAAVLAVGIASVISDFNNKPNAYAWYDLGQSVHSLVLQAADLDIYTHQMAGFDRVAVQEHYQLPAEKEAVVVLALGYLGDEQQLPDALKERELAPQQRKPQSEFVFEGIYPSGK